MATVTERGDGRIAGKTAYRAAVAVALFAVFVLVWGNLALGVIGDEDNNANLMYVGVLAVGVIGTIIARFQPEGMARAMFATALAQALVGATALAARWGDAWDIVMLTTFFSALWLLSAWLFGKALASSDSRRALA